MEWDIFYPTSPDQSLVHTISLDTQVDIKIFLKSGASKLTTIDETTEWNVLISALSPSIDLVSYVHTGVGAAPGLGVLNVGDYVTILGTGEFDVKNTGSFKIYSKTASSFTIKRSSGSAVAQSNAATLQNDTISFFESSATTAQEIVTYVNSNLSEFITSSLVDDGGVTGSGIIDDSTEEDLNYTDSFVRLLDGKNYILTSNIAAGAGLPQFAFKNSLSLSSFSTNTPDAYNFNNKEKIRLVPITANQVSKFLNVLAVTGFTTLGQIKAVDRNSRLQLSTSLLGEVGSVQITGGLGTSSSAIVEGSAVLIGDQSNRKCIISINAASAAGFHSDQWVKVSASSKQKKITSIDATNSIKIDPSISSPEKSIIEVFDKKIQQRFFGRNRYHTRTRGKTFKIEKQGQFACISWNESGTEPFFLKTNVNLKDSSPGTLTIYKDTINNFVVATVDSGFMRFDEVAIGDLVTISNRSNIENNGQFTVIGVSDNAKSLYFTNLNAVDELVEGSFTITDNTLVLGQTFTVGTSFLTEGIDFIAGPTTDDTASNLAAIISLIPNITATSSASVVNINSSIPDVTVALAAGSGAIASGAFMVAPAYNSGDVSVKSEVQEGDSVDILSNFNVLNKGTYRIIKRFKNSIYIDNSSAIEEEVTLSSQIISTGSNLLTNYNIIKLDRVNRLYWGGSGAQPSFANLRPGDTVTLGTDFHFSNRGSFHVVNSDPTFVDYINVNGITESGGVVITDILEFHREAMKFKEYEGTMPGDVFVVTSNFLGNSNKKNFTVLEVLNESKILVDGVSSSTGQVLLGSNFNKIYLEEKIPYVGYKKISFVSTNPANLNNKNMVFDTANQFEKITEIGNVSLMGMSKLAFDTVINKGIDAYKYNTGLIAEVNRIVYGDPRDNTTYPGVAAAGAEIFIKPPLVRRIEVSINVRIKTGVPFTAITEEVRSSVAALINANPVGQAIPISNIVSAVGSIVGIQAVAISSPQYDAQNDVIKISAGEKALVLDIVSDIIVAKIE